MKRLFLLIASVLLLAGISLGQAQDCSYFNSGAPGDNWLDDLFSTGYHINGEHFMDAFHSGSCYYQGFGQCQTTIQLFDTPTPGDEGYPTSFHHVLGDNAVADTESGFGAVTAQAQAGVGTVICPISTCYVSVTIGNGAAGMTFSPATAQPIWGPIVDKYGSTCPARAMLSPLTYDLENEGFQISDATDGVVTDMVSPGHPRRVGWPKRGSHNSMLWLDGHLFGNMVPPYTNGFEALKVYDSNHDGRFNKDDARFRDARMWTDTNHDGIVQPGELRPLPAWFSQSLNYVSHHYIDENGNGYVWESHLENAPKGVNPTVFDIYLTISDPIAPTGN